jgi:hypothetical protein
MYSCTSRALGAPLISFLSVLWRTTTFATKAERFAAISRSLGAGVSVYCIKS